MNFKLISKNNVGAAVLLLLVIAISQSRIFNFLIDSALGRSILIIFILYLSYCHKILGVVGVLFIIIMFNGNNMFNGNMFYEGFGNSNNSSSSSSTDTDASSNSTTDASNSTVTVNKDMLKAMIQKQISDASNNNTSSSSSKPTEGFDILGLENSIKRGKQSNSIPVNQLSRNADSISPYEGEGSTFLGSFSPF
jgi:hypothetical protein